MRPDRQVGRCGGSVALVVRSITLAIAIQVAFQPAHGEAGEVPQRQFEPIPSPSVMQRDTPVQVLVSKQVLGHGHVSYHYRLVNGNPFPIARVTLGYDDFYGVNELLYTPLGWDPDEALASGTQSPPGWTFHLVPTEEDSLFAIEWEVEAGSSALPGGTSLDGFSVTLGGEDAGYERGHWSISTTCEDDYYPHTWFILPDGKTKLHPSSIQAHTGVDVHAAEHGDSVRVAVGPVGGGRVTAQVYGSSGRRVRLLYSGSVPPGTLELLWDGRDDSGSEMPGGGYFVRVWGPQGLRQARVTLARSGGSQGR